MMKAEQIVKEEAIQHEIDTYNELLGSKGELGCVLLIEIADANERPQKLKDWLGLQEKVYLTLDSGERIYAEWDKRQIDEEKLSSVQYLKFNTSGNAPKAIGVDHPGLQDEAKLSDKQREALTEDLELKKFRFQQQVHRFNHFRHIDLAAEHFLLCLSIQ